MYEYTIVVNIINCLIIRSLLKIEHFKNELSRNLIQDNVEIIIMICKCDIQVMKI